VYSENTRLFPTIYPIQQGESFMPKIDYLICHGRKSGVGERVASTVTSKFVEPHEIRLKNMPALNPTLPLRQQWRAYMGRVYQG
jgi:hypothetical protein